MPLGTLMVTFVCTNEFVVGKFNTMFVVNGVPVAGVATIWTGTVPRKFVPNSVTTWLAGLPEGRATDTAFVVPTGMLVPATLEK